MAVNTSSQDAIPATLRPVRALVFDLIGTCTNWHGPVTACLAAHASKVPALATRQANEWNSFAHHWRGAFFRFVSELAAREQMMSMREVYRVTLREVMQRFGVSEQVGEGWGETVQEDLIKSFGMAEAWGDTSAGLRLLRNKFTLVGLSNGSTTTTINTNRRNDMRFDAVLCSDVIETYKPNPKMYKTAIKALEADGKPGEIAMVAAHVYDLEAAKKHGMHTIYIARATEDMDEDASKHEFDLVVNEGGLVELARRLGCVS
ncbi:hypothetical protein FRB99_003933 [Tulasnella sp. 403]|nr:hypothetical protein FRB99_003933 [Tulasnella sp. 403]